MNACTEFRHLLLLYAGEDLEPVQLEAVREHLDRCASCSAVTAAARRAREAYRAGAIRVEAEGIDLWPAIRERIRAEAARPLAPVHSLTAATSAATKEPVTHEPVRSGRKRVLAPTTGRLLPWTAGLAAAAAVVLFARVFLASGPTPGPGAGPFDPVARPTPVESQRGIDESVPLLVQTLPAGPALSFPASQPGADSALVASELPAATDATLSGGGLVRVQDPAQPSLREVLGATGAGAPQWIQVPSSGRDRTRLGDPFEVPGVPASNELH